ncbi:MAG TPA: BACON domain-containing carbohydrate-binding protein, partial [Casimicrobiaceae bacterium]|nr:BACON domain-containing carbohydrate-binding protein [Casimicrobiaceae bacterium]
GRKSYRIQPQPDGHWLQELDPAAFPPDHPEGEDGLQAPRVDKLVQGKATGDIALDTGSTIDLLVVYSTQTATAAGTAIGSQIQAAVDRANLAYANSGIAMRVRLVHHAAAGYSETGNFSTDLQRLAGTSDGYMDTVHALRNTYGADLVSMFIESGAACGIGYIGPSSTAAFTVVSRGCASSNLSLAHEIGHNFGARHDPYMDASTSPYAYGHGHVNTTYKWRTVMAYNNACSAAGTSCTRIAYFSNPNVAYGTTPQPTGTSSTSDNARVHNGNAYTVANYRQATSGTTPTCTYSLSPSTSSVGAAGGTGSTSVTAGSGCAWSSTSSAAWLTIGSGSGTSGTGTLAYVAAANAGPARSATIRVGTASLTVNQTSGCTYTVSPTSATIGAAGGTQSVSVTTSAGCTWSASSGAAWMTIGTGASGSGNGTVTYNVSSNTGALRAGNLTIAGKTVTVTQSAPATTCSYALTPSTVSVGAAGGTGSTSVTAGSGCAWSSTSSAAWLTIGSGSGTSGAGTLAYVAAANTGPARSATIKVGTATLTVNQSSGCTYTVSPTSATIGAAGGTQSVTVTASSASCTWTASSGASWMTIASGTGGSGSGTVTYNVAGNTGAQRSGSLTVAGKAVTVTQGAAAATAPVTSATLSPTAMDFGNVQVGQVTAVQSASFTNTGTTAVTISSIGLGGPNPADFVASHACYAGQTLQPGQSCAVRYAFSPKAWGKRSAAATVASSAGTKSLELKGSSRDNSRGKP